MTGDIDIGGAFYGAILKLIAARAPIKAVVGYYASDANTYYGYYGKDDNPLKNARPDRQEGRRQYARCASGVRAARISRPQRPLSKRGQAGDAGGDPAGSGEQALRQGQVEVSALSGVLRDKALDRGGINSLFNDIDLFGQFTGGSYVLRDKFIKDNPEASRRLIEGISRAIAWAQTTQAEEVRARFDRIIAERKRNEDASSIKYWKSTGVATKGGLDLGRRNPGLD
ncbi:hypothetical protein [Bradyrhizobium sp. Rc3b]|uniref:hypothetical protein n=1 Tax=Bradyrhizobium sp. Rc3b TaxID=1855322 RepID=UPI001FCCEC23|nr:hypothetical protein [Bradyrhizobium sp. Rc3b]